MANPGGLGPTKIPLLIESHEPALYCKSDYGPTFGAGHDLHNANISYDSHTILGCSYQCPTGQNAKTFLAGEKHFTVTDYEVFGNNKLNIPFACKRP